MLGTLLKKKKVIRYITSFFSQILTELHRYKINLLPGKVTIVTLQKGSNMSNNLDAPILNVK